MTERERMHLGYLAKAGRPLWGGHLKRGEPITDPDMQRWINLGWIQNFKDQGYLLTAKGLRLLDEQTPAYSGER